MKWPLCDKKGVLYQHSKSNLVSSFNYWKRQEDILYGLIVSGASLKAINRQADKAKEAHTESIKDIKRGNEFLEHLYEINYG